MSEYAKIVKYLSDQYPACADLFMSSEGVEVKKNDDLRVPEAVVRVVIGQMLSRTAATTIFTKVINYSSKQSLNSWELSFDEYKQLGLSHSKANTITSFAKYYQANAGEVELWPEFSFDKLLDATTKHKGIGVWTASILGIFYFGHTDVFPDGDGTLRRAMKKIEESYGVCIDPDLAKPFRSYLSLFLWQAIDSGRL